MRKQLIKDIKNKSYTFNTINMREYQILYVILYSGLALAQGNNELDNGATSSIAITTNDASSQSLTPQQGGFQPIIVSESPSPIATGNATNLSNPSTAIDNKTLTNNTTTPPLDPNTEISPNCPLPQDSCRYIGSIKCLPNQAPCTNCWLKPKTFANRRNTWRCVRVDSEGNCPKFIGLVDILKDCNKLDYPKQKPLVLRGSGKQRL